MYDLLIHFIFIWASFFQKTDIWLGKSNILPNLMGTIGLALLTILIPLAIAILGDILQKKREKNADLTVLDLHVILDSVLKFKLLLLCTSIIFLPLFFWELQIGIIRILIIHLWIAGIVLLGDIVFDMYLWSKGNVWDFRFRYLKKLRQPKDLELVWHSVWQTENINERDEEKFFEIFSSQIDNFLNNAEKKRNNFDLILRLLGDFKSFIKNRSIFLLTTGHKVAFPKILEWHFSAWKKHREYLHREDELEIWSRYGQILSILNAISQFIEELSLTERDSFWFFDYLKKHVTAFEKAFVESKKKGRVFYRKYLLGIFYSVFFKNSPYEYDIWESFPEEWLVKKGNLENEENLISWTSLNKFLMWAQDRVQLAEETRDKQLDNVILNLFPEVDPRTWSIILIFIYSGGSIENGIKSATERPWNFGLIGRAVTGWGENLEKKLEESIGEQERNTLELAPLIFKNQFTRECLERYIKELKQLVNVYSIGSRKEEHRIELLRIFEKMLSLIH